MITSTKKNITLLVEQFLVAGVETFVCSPGSRNAPIVIALDEHPDTTCYVIHDERSAAFIAMGMAQASNSPVAVVCTSGSAMLNYYPAVAEAYYQRIPLLVISADRPERWINQGDGQTIVQREVYANHIDGETHISDAMQTDEVESKLIGILQKLQHPSKGPLHINVALDEPLYNTREIEYQPIKKTAHTFSPKKTQLSEKELKEITQLPKKLILVGQLPKNKILREKLLDVSSDPSYAVLVENTSNLTGQKWVHCIDRALALINENQTEEFTPDCLITIGGAIVSKRIKAYLRKHKPKIHWRIGFDFPKMNTFDTATKSIEDKPERILELLSNHRTEMPTSNFGAKWKQLDLIAEQNANAFHEKNTFSDLKVMELVLDAVPENAYLHLGNSSVVRYAQLFNPISTIHYHSNRGTSGIDGSVSTAVGAALASPNKMHVLITGDVSFFYDSNALWQNYTIPNLRIVLINNGGGGIFDIIPGPKATQQKEKFFVAEHNYSATYICETFHVGYMTANSTVELTSKLGEFLDFATDGTMKLLEINTTTCENANVLENYFKKLNKY